MNKQKKLWEQKYCWLQFNLYWLSSIYFIIWLIPPTLAQTLDSFSDKNQPLTSNSELISSFSASHLSSLPSEWVGCWGLGVKEGERGEGFPTSFGTIELKPPPSTQCINLVEVDSSFELSLSPNSRSKQQIKTELSQAESNNSSTTNCPKNGSSLMTETETLLIQKIEVLNSTVFNQSDFKEILEIKTEQLISLSELEQKANEITRRYLEAGYINSYACLLAINTTEKIAQIQVFEGQLKEIEIEGTERLAEYISSRLWLSANPPLNAIKIDQQLRLLKTSPLIKDIKASLRPSPKEGESILIVQVEEANALTIGLSSDNYSPPILGSERLGVELGYRNLTGIGDTFSASHYRSTTGGSEIFDFKYNAPLNPTDGTLQLRTFLSRSDFDTQQTFAFINQGQLTQQTFNLELSSDYDIYQISYRQPFIRSFQEEFAVSFQYTYRNGFPLEALQATNLPTILEEFIQELGLEPGLENLGLFNSDLSQDKTSVLMLGVDYINRDPLGIWTISSQLNFGTDFFDATVRPSPFADSRFFSWLFQVQRLHRLGKNHLLIVIGELQLTPDSLLSSQQFVIGGGQSIRGYRQNLRFGDNGFRLSIEDRITLVRNEQEDPIFQIAPFVDMGNVWNDPDNPIPIPPQKFLAGIGIGLLWTPTSNMNIRLDFAAPLVDIENEGNNLQDDGIYFSVNYRL